MAVCEAKERLQDYPGNWLRTVPGSPRFGSGRSRTIWCLHRCQAGSGRERMLGVLYWYTSARYRRLVVRCQVGVLWLADNMESGRSGTSHRRRKTFRINAWAQALGMVLLCRRNGQCRWCGRRECWGYRSRVRGFRVQIGGRSGRLESARFCVFVCLCVAWFQGVSQKWGWVLVVIVLSNENVAVGRVRGKFFGGAVRAVWRKRGDQKRERFQDWSRVSGRGKLCENGQWGVWYGFGVSAGPVCVRDYIYWKCVNIPSSWMFDVFWTWEMGD